jgi:hypothetical protein
MPRSNRSSKSRFMLSVQGRSDPRVAGNEPQLTVNLLTGNDEHFVYAGTFTVTEREFDDLTHVLKSGLGDRFELAFGPLRRSRSTSERSTQTRRRSKKAA